MGKMKEKPVDLLEKVRDELIATGLKFKKDKLENGGSLSSNDANAFSNLMRSAIYVEQMRYQEESGLGIKVEQSGEMKLSKADKERLDKIAKLMEEKP